MSLPTTDAYADIREHLDRLANELRETKRELERVRLDRRMPPVIVPLLVMALAAALTTGSLDAQGAGRIVAPFTVVDKTGRLLFKVDNDNDRPTVIAGLVQMGTGASGGGYVAVQRPNGNTAVALGQRNGNFGLRLFDITGDTELATVSEAKVGGGVFVANDGAGKTRMLMSGTGQLHAVDGSGNTRATMTADGAFSIRNAAGTTIARVAESGGTGQLQLANSGGNAIVEAGMLGTGAGVVRAYPLGLGGPVGNLAGLGAPGTFIVGFLGSTTK